MLGEFFSSVMAITLFGSFVWAAIVVAIFVILLFVSETDENGYIATIFTILGAGLFFFWGRETFDVLISLFTWKSILLYIGVGLIYAIIRIFFFGRKQMYKVNDSVRNNDSYQPSIQTDVRDHMFRWWLLWPISLLVWAVKDIVRDIYNWFYDTFEKFFKKILILGVKSVKQVDGVKDLKINK